MATGENWRTLVFVNLQHQDDLDRATLVAAGSFRGQPETIAYVDRELTLTALLAGSGAMFLTLDIAIDQYR